jgi:hypothetical protein
MATSDFLDLWMWISTNTSMGWLGGTISGASLLLNYYLYTRLDKKDKSEQVLIETLERLEPLLSKIINEGDKIFTKTEVNDAIVIRRMINFKQIKK